MSNSPFVLFCFVLFFETGFLCIALAVLELTLQTRLASNSEICLPLPPECTTTPDHVLFFKKKIYLFIMFTVPECQKRHQIPLQMVVIHHVVAGN